MLRSPPSSSLLPLVHCTVGHTWIVLSFNIFSSYDKRQLSALTDTQKPFKVLIFTLTSKTHQSVSSSVLTLWQSQTSPRSRRPTPVWHKLWVRSVGRLWAAGLTILPRPSFHGWRLLDGHHNYVKYGHHKYRNSKYRNTKVFNRLSLDFAMTVPPSLPWPTSFRPSKQATKNPCKIHQHSH